MAPSQPGTKIRSANLKLYIASRARLLNTYVVQSDPNRAPPYPRYLVLPASLHAQQFHQISTRHAKHTIRVCLYAQLDRHIFRHHNHQPFPNALTGQQFAIMTNIKNIEDITLLVQEDSAVVISSLTLFATPYGINLLKNKASAREGLYVPDMFWSFIT